MKAKLTEWDALLIVDAQCDFMPGGALPVREGDRIVPVTNRYIARFAAAGLPVYLSRDWHPEDHLSFRAQGGIWPVHCVAGSAGAAFHPKLAVPADNRFIISKGTSREFDAYSAFQGTLLKELLAERGIKRAFIGGLATDYCVKETVCGALNLGYEVLLLLDAVRGVDVAAGDSEKAVNIMLSRGAVGVTEEEITP